ncbi:MAG: hypothetical protein NTW60_02895 [Candidatus Wolfebacteria bacterium]|nr:hypothetical protein [Candidatus Wolfebacteria bacterium]
MNRTFSGIFGESHLDTIPSRCRTNMVGWIIMLPRGVKETAMRFSKWVTFLFVLIALSAISAGYNGVWWPFKPSAPATTPIPKTASLPSDSAEVRAQIAKLEREKQELAAKLAECEQLCPKIPPCAPVAKLAPKPKPKPVAPEVEWIKCPNGGHVRKGQKCPPPAPAARAAALAPATPAPVQDAKAERMLLTAGGPLTLWTDIKNQSGMSQQGVPMVFTFFKKGVGTVGQLILKNTDAAGIVELNYPTGADCATVEIAKQAWPLLVAAKPEGGYRIYDRGMTNICVKDASLTTRIHVGPFVVADHPVGTLPSIPKMAN